MKHTLSNGKKTWVNIDMFLNGKDEPASFSYLIWDQLKTIPPAIENEYLLYFSIFS